MRRKQGTSARELEQGEVNIIPIVDVSFCLVIFCLTTMNLMLTAGINVLESRAGASSGKAALSENISVRLTAENKIYVDNKEVPEYELFRELAVRIPKTKDGMVIITADERNTCEQVVDILDVSKKSGAKRLALMQNAPAVGS
jgi:biopolymer transport protein ExbD